MLHIMLFMNIQDIVLTSIFSTESKDFGNSSLIYLRLHSINFNNRIHFFALLFGIVSRHDGNHHSLHTFDFHCPNYFKLNIMKNIMGYISAIISNNYLCLIHQYCFGDFYFLLLIFNIS